MSLGHQGLNVLAGYDEGVEVKLACYKCLSLRGHLVRNRSLVPSSSCILHVEAAQVLFRGRNEAYGLCGPCSPIHLLFPLSPCAPHAPFLSK